MARSGDEDLPAERLAQYTAADFDRAYQVSGSRKGELPAGKPEPHDPVADKRFLQKLTELRLNPSREHSENRAINDLGYKTFDSTLFSTDDRPAVMVDPENDYSAGDLPTTAEVETREAVLRSEYADPLEEVKTLVDPPPSAFSDDPFCPPPEAIAVYPAGAVEDLAELFSNGSTTEDAYLRRWYKPAENYRSSDWVQQATVNAFRSWTVSVRNYRTADEWLSLFVPHHAKRFMCTVHERGPLKTLVMLIREGLFLSVVLEQHKNDKTYRIKARYYTFSLQLSAQYLEIPARK